MLKKGDSGKAVLELQGKLQKLGFYKGAMDGSYGDKTAQAVVSFQSLYFSDGIANDPTIKSIDAALLAWSNLQTFVSFKPPHGLQEIENTFGRILFENSDNGAVIIKNDFAKNVVFTEFPVVGKQYIHSKLVDVLLWSMKKVEERGLDREILQFGSWYPRHKRHNASLGLSTHSWAIAFDINWATNPYGGKSTLHPGIIEIFKKSGFDWGGEWIVKDPMHFQYATGY